MNLLIVYLIGAGTTLLYMAIRAEKIFKQHEGQGDPDWAMGAAFLTVIAVILWPIPVCVFLENIALKVKARISRSRTKELPL